MKYSQLMLTVAAILALAVDNLDAEKVIDLHKQFSGSSAPIAMDLNNDGLPAIRAIGGGSSVSVRPPARSRLSDERNFLEGEFTADHVSEAVPVGEPTGKCATSEIEFEMIHYSTVTRYRNGDLLVARLKDGFVCFNPLTRRGYGTVRLEPFGGTGRFEGAEGELVREFQGLGLDPTGLRSTFTATEQGSLILPD